MESQEDEHELGERVRKFTEKGRQYDRQQLNELYGKLNNQSQVLIDKIHEKTPLDILRPMFSEWMVTYEHYLEKHERHHKQLSSEDKEEYLADFRAKNSIMQEFRKSTKTYMYEAEQAKLRETQMSQSVEVSKKASHSSKSSTSTSKSRISSRRLQEEEKKVELLEKMKALQKKKDIEIAKTKLKLEEEELELSTDIAVSEAKTKLLEKFDRVSEELDLENDSTSSVSGEASVSGEEQLVAKSKLNPDAKPFNVDDETELKIPVRVYEPAVGLNENFATNFGQVREPIRVRCSELENWNKDAIDSVVRHLRKPVPEIKKFGGDPMEYRKFLRQFQAKIMSNTSNNEENMSYLEQYTVGEANKVVSGFSHLNGELAFPTAMNQLEDRYGNQDVIATAFAKKALDWPSIKYGDTKALDNFALFLVECENAVTSIGVGCILEFSENIRRLVSKLPYNLHDKWRNIVLKTKESGKQIKFSQFVAFVKQEAKKVNDPLYGSEALSTRSKSVQDKDIRRRQVGTGGRRNQIGNVSDITAACTNSSSNVNDTGSKCYYCKSNSHRISNCRSFMSLKVQDRCDHIRKSGLCFGCLKKGHKSSDCRDRQECAVCKKKHPTLLHDESKTNTQAQITESKFQMDSHLCATPVDICGQTGAGDITSAMSIIPVRVKLKNKPYSIVTYAFFDTGSNVTFCTESLMSKLGAQGKKLNLTLGTIGDPYSMETYSVNGLQICDLDMKSIIDLPRIYTKEELPVTTDHIPSESEISKWPHLSDIKMPNIDSNSIGVMIGGNVPDAFTPYDIRTGPSGSPHATKTRLGWIVWNITRDRNENTSHQVVVNRTYVTKIEQVDKCSRLEELVKESMKLDFPERQIDDKCENSLEDSKFLTQVNESVRYHNGHFSIKLPFRDSAVKFPGNKPQALKRLKSLRAKLDKNSKFRDDYVKFMDSILDKGYAELVPTEILNRSDGKVWYLPHHGVYHQRKPDKVRVVFDCSAVYDGVSLNRELLQGPDLTNNLLGVLLRFRQDNVAVLGDIEAMFHQVKVPEEDRDCLRFLWWPDGDTKKEPKEYRMTVHLFGATSSPSCCNFAIQCTANLFGEQFEPNIKETLLNNMYVDDCLASVDSARKAVKLVKDLSALCKLGGFHLTKWTSNEPNVINEFPEEETIKHWDPESNSQIEHALGICWFVEIDHFGFQLSMKDRPITRRGILSIVSSIYDPLGIVAPFVLVGKIILQDLCRRKIGWDESIPESDDKKWKKWLSETSEIERVVVKRSYKPENFGDVTHSEIHCFSDASNLGYGMVFYLRLVNSEGKVHCAFLLGKSRVAPLKSVTIPRLELTAASRSVRICERIRNEINIKIDHVYYWTDSTSVLRYIFNTNARFHTFVANRLVIIHEATTPDQWNYIDTKENPADCASRGMSITKFSSDSVWLQGPDFLWNPMSVWPQHDINKELRSDDTEVKQVFSTVHTESSSNTVMSRLLSYFSDWIKLKRVTAWILKYIDNTRSRVRCDEKKQTSKMLLSADLLERSEKCLVKYIQQEAFPEEYKRLSKEPSENLKGASKLYQLNVFMEDGIIRAGGRLRKSDLSFEAKYPVVLPKESPVSKLLVESIHRKIGHLGKNSILANLRQKYWIIGANSLIKQVLSKCVTCKKHQGLPEKQKMADLPSERLQSDIPPFTNVGIDFFGPFYVKRARSQVKRYGVIFTCLSSRAVHLEIAFSLDTDSCINAIRRFIARRGVPKFIRTDNGTNFVGAERELRLEIERWNLNRLNNYLIEREIKWEFNPPAASHFGGVWERLIRSVRKVLYSVIQEQTIKIDDEGLQTLFCEVEAILNGRPLTEATNSVNDLEVLTPNHLLLLKAGEHCPPGLFDKTDNYVRRRWRQVQYLANLFWRRWTKEYLPLLRIRQKWNDRHDNIKVNDIVLIAENTPRNLWNLGRVIEIFKGDGGQVRVVKLKTASGILIRPIVKVCKILEV